MGWFLSSSTGKPKKKVRKSAKPAVKGWDPRKTLAVLEVLATVAVLALLGLGWRHAERYLMNYAHEKRPLPTGTEQVELAGAPYWMSPMLQRDLRVAVARDLGNDAMRSDDLGSAVRTLAASPWVEGVERIRRMPGGKIVVNAKYREPIAFVEEADGMRLVDEKSVRLPGLYSQAEAQKIGLPIITGVKSSPPGEGAAWKGEELSSGLALVKMLRGQPYLSQVTAFDVSERDARNRVRLMLKTRQGLVRWGLPPGQEATIEPTAAVKMAWLGRIYRDKGQIDAGGQIVDVYGAAAFIHQPDREDPGLTVGYSVDQ
ncbi:MAG: hypothetical protein K8S99_09185 [Planctomycetes bacterium]|nr:hypothetical protein [Planctomycetota bacterium]